MAVECQEVKWAVFSIPDFPMSGVHGQKGLLYALLKRDSAIVSGLMKFSIMLLFVIWFGNLKNCLKNLQIGLFC